MLPDVLCRPFYVVVHSVPILSHNIADSDCSFDMTDSSADSVFWCAKSSRPFCCSVGPVKCICRAVCNLFGCRVVQGIDCIWSALEGRSSVAQLTYTVLGMRISCVLNVSSVVDYTLNWPTVFDISFNSGAFARQPESVNCLGPYG